MKDVAESKLAEPNTVRHDGSVVGWIEDNDGKNDLFVWQQSVYFYSEGGYSMSNELYLELLDNGVKYIAIPPAHDPTWVEKTDFLRESTKVEPFDPRFSDGERPDDTQWVYPAPHPDEEDDTGGSSVRAKDKTGLSATHS